MALSPALQGSGMVRIKGVDMLTLVVSGLYIFLFSLVEFKFVGLCTIVQNPVCLLKWWPRADCELIGDGLLPSSLFIVIFFAIILAQR